VHACVTLLMAGGLTLATVIVVATVSIEVVKAANHPRADYGK
jgi:hypothetical protein